MMQVRSNKSLLRLCFVLVMGLYLLLAVLSVGNYIPLVECNYGTTAVVVEFEFFLNYSYEMFLFGAYGTGLQT